MKSDTYVDFFRQTSPYIHKHRGKTFVIAVDGDTVAHANFHRTIHDIALLQSLGIRIVLVHGGRPQIDQCIAQAGAQSQFHNQLRITRVIECLRLLVSDEEADNFYKNVLELIKDNNQVNMRTLNFWKNA